MPQDLAPPPRPVGALPATRAIRRPELRKIEPLTDTTIYEMERRGEFPRRFSLTRCCVVWDLGSGIWDLGEIETWLAHRNHAALDPSAAPAEGPDVQTRRTRPVQRTR